MLDKFINKLKNKPKNKARSRDSRTYLTAGESLYLNNNKNIKIEQITSEVKQLFKNPSSSIEDVVKLIESKGSKVIKAKHMDIVLKLIGEEEGFIVPIKGLKALFLSVMINILSPTKIPVGFDTQEMFIFQDKPYSTYLLIHQVYHWLSYLRGLPGYEDSSLDTFKHIFSNNFTFADIDKMSINDIISLKETIARDLEAINLVKEIVRETMGSKNCFEKMTKGQSFNL